MLRALLLLVIAYIAIRLVRSFLNIKRSSGPDESPDLTGGGANQSKPPDDLRGQEIKDAEFEDLTPPENPPEPPKSS